MIIIFYVLLGESQAIFLFFQNFLKISKSPSCRFQIEFLALMQAGLANIEDNEMTKIVSEFWCETRNLARNGSKTGLVALNP